MQGNAVPADVLTQSLYLQLLTSSVPTPQI